MMVRIKQVLLFREESMGVALIVAMKRIVFTTMYVTILKRQIKASKLNHAFTVMPTKSNSDVMFC